jgi:hypothetical protein
MTRPEDPMHPILDKPWEYEIVGFDYQAVEGEPHLDLTLRRGADIRQLRFLGPKSINLEEGFSDSPGPSGIAILDVRARQMEGLGVHVSDSVTGHDCKLTLWARDVIPQ